MEMHRLSAFAPIVHMDQVEVESFIQLHPNSFRTPARIQVEQLAVESRRVCLCYAMLRFSDYSVTCPRRKVGRFVLRERAV